MVMATRTVLRVAPDSETTAIASRMLGIAINPSITRIITASTHLKKPETRPMRRPMAMLVTAAPSPISIAAGLVIGLVSGFFKWVDAVMMRVMDGLMAIPSILLAIAVVSLSGASVMTVLIAITIPEIPRVARLVRSVVLSAREEP